MDLFLGFYIKCELFLLYLRFLVIDVSDNRDLYSTLPLVPDSGFITLAAVS